MNVCRRSCVFMALTVGSVVSGALSQPTQPTI